MWIRRFVPDVSAGPGWQGPVSDHFDGRAFFNPAAISAHGLLDLLRWRLLGKRERWPTLAGDVNTATDLCDVADGEIAVTVVGHASFLIQFPGLNLLTDPVWSERASPAGWVGPRRVRPPGIRWEGLPRVDVVLVSHNHYDHLDLPTLRGLRSRFDPLIITGLGNGAFLAARGFRHWSELDWWQTATIPKCGVHATFVPARHWSNRGLGGRNTTLWGGFVIEAESKFRIYFAGDTGMFDGFRDIRARTGQPDLALLPIGAYEPRWFMSTMHMNPEEAVQAHCLLGARQSLGAHFGVWQLGDEAIDDPIRALAAACKRHCVSREAFLAPNAGATLRLV